MTDSFNEEVFERLTEILGDDNEAEIEADMMALIEALGPEKMILFSASQFLGREAMLNRDKRLYYAATALLALIGLVQDMVEEDITLVGAMDYSDNAFDEALRAFDQAIESLTEDALKEMRL